MSSYPEIEEPRVAKQNVPKDELRGPYSGQPIHLAAGTGAGASYRVATVGCWRTASGVRGVESVGINQGRRHWPGVNGRVGGAARLQMEHFLECVTIGTRPLCDGEAGRAALAVCLAAEASLANDGAEIPLSAIEQAREFERSEGG